MILRNDDIEKMTSKCFWPPGIWIMEWFDDPYDEQSSGNDKSSEDEST